MAVTAPGDANDHTATKCYRQQNVYALGKKKHQPTGGGFRAASVGGGLTVFPFTHGCFAHSQTPSKLVLAQP